VVVLSVSTDRNDNDAKIKSWLSSNGISGSPTHPVCSGVEGAGVTAYVSAYAGDYAVNYAVVAPNRQLVWQNWHLETNEFSPLATQYSIKKHSCSEIPTETLPQKIRSNEPTAKIRYVGNTMIKVEPDVFSISMYTVAGKLLKRVDLNNSGNRLVDIAFLGNGIHVVKATTAKGSFFQRITTGN